MKKIASVQGIFSIKIRNDVRINILRTFCGEPDQTAYLIAASLKLMKGADPTSLDMRDFASALICAGRTAASKNFDVTQDYRGGGFLIVEPGDPSQLLTRKVQWLYTLSKPYRALHIKVDQVLWEERAPAVVDVFSGLFVDYHKHIDGIMQNIRGEIDV